MSKRIWPRLQAILIDPEIKKIASNMKFEHAWSQVILGVTPQGWLWDTMLAAHILDNRRGITSIKFQAFVRFGVEDYDSHISSFLEGVEPKNANSLNRIHKLDKNDTCVYNGMDCFVEYYVALEQMIETYGSLKGIL